jgi:hypothetical protein
MKEEARPADVESLLKPVYDQIDRRAARGLVAALAAFQAELPTIMKDSTAKVLTKTGGTYTYDYADLAVVAGVVLPALGRQGLAYSAKILPGKLICQLRHVSGEMDESEWPIPEGTAQEVGSQITYGRRYCLLAMTGVHPVGEDDDGAAASKRMHDRNGEPTSGPPPNQTASPVAPLAAVISKGREAGLTDEMIRKDIELIAKGRPHTSLTTEELRKLWLEYQGAARAVAEVAEEAARQQAAAAEVGTDPIADAIAAHAADAPDDVLRDDRPGQDVRPVEELAADAYAAAGGKPALDQPDGEDPDDPPWDQEPTGQSDVDAPEDQSGKTTVDEREVPESVLRLRRLVEEKNAQMAAGKQKPAETVPAEPEGEPDGRAAARAAATAAGRPRRRAEGTE